MVFTAQSRDIISRDVRNGQRMCGICVRRTETPNLTPFAHAVKTGARSPHGQGIKTHVQKTSPLPTGKNQVTHVWGGELGLKRRWQNDLEQLNHFTAVGYLLFCWLLIRQ